jgi:hypothetical protein
LVAGVILGSDRSLNAVRSTTEKSYSLPVLIGDHSIVDAESAAPHLLFHNSREDIA